MLQRVLLFVIFLAFLYPCPSFSQEKLDTEVILQGFHWHSHEAKPWWDVIKNKASEISQTGFTMVWFPPSSASASKEGYLPNRLYHQNSNYGNVDQLKGAIRALHSYKVKAIADIVINHRVGTKDWADFTEPKWGPDSVCRGDEWPGASGNYDSGHGYHAARDIDHRQTYVQHSIQDWMLWLKKEIGYDGWRYDYSKGYGAEFVKIYNEKTSPCISIGEFWDNLNINDYNPHRQQLCNWIDKAKAKTSAFDFTTKGLLQQAVGYSEYWRMKDSEGKPSGLIGWWPEKAVTFIDNHDTGPSTRNKNGQNHWPFPGDKVMQGYAYILTHPGTPCVYWVHVFDWGLHKEIKALINIRKSYGLNAKSKVKIVVADSSKYAAIIDGKVAMKIGHGDWNPGSGWALRATGKDYAVWVK